VTDTEANTIVRPLYLFITIVIIKEGRTKKAESALQEEENNQIKINMNNCFIENDTSSPYVLYSGLFFKLNPT
jgi:hypothetical protein